MSDGVVVRTSREQTLLGHAKGNDGAWKAVATLM